MAISRTGIETATTGGGGSSVTVSVPAGASEGDLMLGVVHTSSPVLAFIPDGWNPVILAQDHVGTLVSVFYKFVEAGEAANHTFSIDSTKFIIGSIASYSGVHSVRPVNVFSSAHSAAADTTATAPGITTTEDNCVLVGYATAKGTGITFTKPASMTEIYDTNDNSRVGTMAEETLGTAGATGDKTFTLSASGENSVVLLALTPDTASSSGGSAPTVVGSTTYNSEGVASSTVVLNKPAGLAEGDLMVAAMAHGGNGFPTVEPPDGWELIRDDSLTGNAIGHRTFVKLATASEPASYTFTIDSSKHPVGILRAYRGTDIIIDVHGGDRDNTGSTTPTATGITTSRDNALLVYISSVKAADDPVSYTAPGGMSEIFDDYNTARALTLAEESLGTAGATGNRAGTTNKTGPWVATLIAIVVPEESAASGWIRPLILNRLTRARRGR